MIIISVNSAHLLLVYFFNCWPLGQSVSIKIITKNGGWWWMKMFENRCEWMQRGRARTFFLLNFFPFQPFSFISDKNRLMKVPNSYFFLNIFKNRLKWIKNPNLHDSQNALLWYFAILISDRRSFHLHQGCVGVQAAQKWKEAFPSFPSFYLSHNLWNKQSDLAHCALWV